MTISSRALCETNLLIYFIMNKGIPIHARASVSMLFRFYKTLSGYLDTRPIDQDGYFDFKDRYYRAVNRTYRMDQFVAENYVLMWQNLEQLMGRSYDWRKWTESFMDIKDLDLRPVQFEKEEELDGYLEAHEGLGSAFCTLLGWEEELDPICRKLVWLLKKESLLTRIVEDSDLSRRYFPLLNSEIISISEIEFIKKPVAFKDLIDQFLSKGRIKIDEIEQEIMHIPKKRRALIRTILYVLRHQNKRVSTYPQVLFKQPPSFKYLLKYLSFRFWLYGIRGFFEKEVALKKG